MNVKVSIERLCDEVGMTRQNFNKGHKKRVRQKVDEDLIRDLVVWERALQPRLGGRKLYVLLKSEFKAAGIRIGRDRFFDVMRRQGLLLDPLPKAPKTTNSRHSLPVFSNLLVDMTIDGPDMAWLSDITYIRTDEGFLYLSLITDDWSRKIVGYNAGDSLETEGCLNALEQAIYLYNHRRPHAALNYRIPAEVHDKLKQAA